MPTASQSMSLSAVACFAPEASTSSAPRSCSIPDIVRVGDLDNWGRCDGVKNLGDLLRCWWEERVGGVGWFVYTGRVVVQMVAGKMPDVQIRFTSSDY